ncbi:MAG: hypothetical protein H6747_12150 [Deltaproteobacteria bacterium]|nr:hypothetical protein [Deltaproteobacteria bacterium]
MHPPDNPPCPRRPRALRLLLLLLVLLLAASCSSEDTLAPGPADADASALDIGGDVAIFDADTGPGEPPDCPIGYRVFPPDAGADAQCVVDGALQCAPCKTDADCLGGFCTTVDGEGPFCLIPCSPKLGDSCPGGQTCTPVVGGDGDASAAGVCRPDNGSCSCGPASVGAQRPCISKASGCEGEQRCEAGGWAICDAPAATAEACNGVDDDCDTQIDEGLSAPFSCVHTGEFGTCPGQASCQGAAGWVCDAPAALAEACNGVDDDCDGQSDEDFQVEGVFSTDAHCGVCGNDCTGKVLHGTAACDATALPPFCAVAACEPGYVQQGNACVPKTVGACDPCLVDSDCGIVGACIATKQKGLPENVCLLGCDAEGGCPGGLACQTIAGAKRCVPSEPTCTCDATNAGAKRSCSKSSSAGTCGGQETCVPGDGWVGCSAQNPAAETCNGKDDDCDGKVDEGAGAGADCPVSNPFGVCTGKTICTGTGGLLCQGEAASADVCNGVDDDCDGETDEGALDQATGTYHSLLHCGGCYQACPQPTAAHSEAICDDGKDNGAGGKPTCAVQCETGWTDANGDLADGCECKTGATDDVPGGGDDNCDGVDGNASKAIFVAKWGNDLWEGTPEKPLLTIGKGIGKAAAENKRDVYVGAGAFNEQVVLAAGVSVWGGFSADFGARDATVYETLISPPASAGAAVGGQVATLRCEKITGTGEKTRVDGVTVIGGSPKGVGTSTYAVLAIGCDARFELRDSRILAGTGAKGSDGGAGANGIPGVAGAPGKIAGDTGHKGCGFGDYKIGGSGGARTCSAPASDGATQQIDVSGGTGGTSICPDFHEKLKPPQCPLFGGGGQSQSQDPLARGQSGKGAGQFAGTPGVGGAPGADAYTEPFNGKVTSCNNKNYSCESCLVPLMVRTGGTGAPGKSGSFGNGGSGGSGGVATESGWVGKVGNDGGDGRHGGGGGGGGSGGGVETISCEKEAGFDDLGGSGGGGGSGGCGGEGGAGGGPGGASFGIYLWVQGGSVPVLSGNVVHGGVGGDGGAGGPGGWGGPGAPGGAGGEGTPEIEISGCAPEGGEGGEGGDGGSGGGGGGGAGGPAILIAAKGVPTAWTGQVAQQNTLAKLGLPGKGGTGGAAAPGTGVDGVAGEQALVRRWP